MEDTPLLALPRNAETAGLSRLVWQLRRELDELRREVAKLRQENTELRRENAELRQQAGYWKAMHARAVHRIEHLEAELEQQRGENRKLQDQLFGRKSEKSPAQDRSNRLEGENDDQGLFTRRRAASRKITLARRRDYSSLPVVEDLLELPEDQRVCPQCGAPLSPSGTQGFRADRNRREGLSPTVSAATLPADLHLWRLPSHIRCPAGFQADSQGITGHLGVGGNLD